MAATQAAKDRVAAGAQGGTAAVNAYDQGRGAVKASRTAAINAMDAEARQFGAPGALTRQLNSTVGQPGTTALGNLGMLGSVAENASQLEDQAANVYKLEAAQALPVITAEDNRDLAQQLEMLAAQRAHAGGGGGGGSFGGLSDAELRNRIMGLALQQRQILGQQLAASAARNAQMESTSRGYALGRAREAHTFVTPDANQQHMTSYRGGALSPLDAYLQTQNRGGPGQPPSEFGTNPQPGQLGSAGQAEMGRLNQEYGQRVQALAELLKARTNNQVYGPGISGEAQQIALGLGVDPATAYGLVGPNEEASYLRANQAAGLYTPPKPQQVANQTLTAEQAGQALGWKPGDVRRAATAPHWAFSDHSSAAYAAIKAWVAANPKLFPNAPTDPNTGAPSYPAMSPDDQAKAQLAFRALPNARDVQTNVVADVLADANTASGRGLDFDTWRQGLMSVPEYRYDPRSFQLAFAQAEPLFVYAASHLRNQPVPAG
jgi:hypothetical protein